MKIDHHPGISRGSFKSLQDDTETGIMTYHWDNPSKMVIEHTEVKEEYAGKGVAKKLVMEGVDYARKNSLKILPLCSYAKKVFDTTPEIQDVLFKK